jgi:hypothetical protein
MRAVVLADGVEPNAGVGAAGREAPLIGAGHGR